MLVYCILKIEEKYFSSDNDIVVDFGKDDALIIRLSDSIRQQTADVSRYKSAVDALNYMASIGWDIVHLMPLTTAAGTSVGNLSYLMSRNA